MSKKHSRKMRRQFKEIQASKEAPAPQTQIGPPENPAPKGVPGAPEEDGFYRLHPRCPDPEAPLAPLSEPYARKLTHRVMEQLQALQPNLNMTYWRKFTYQFLRSDASRVLVNPARAGSGKSTWIRAFLLTLAKGYAAGDELMECFGGVLLIVQKVEDLNAIAQEINQLVSFPEEPLMVALQSLTHSGKTYQLCQNTEAQNYRDCVDCPHRETCALVQSGFRSKQAYILGATQKRFYSLRSSGELDTQLLFRVQANGAMIRRRFVLFDEKPELTQIAVLDQRSLNTLSTQLEELPAQRGARDCQVSFLQDTLNYLGIRPLQKLRRETVIQLPNGRKAEELAGFCHLQDGTPERVKELQSSLVRVLGQSSGELQSCLPALHALHQGKECLFCKISGFHISYAWDGLDCLRGHQALIFDATAEVDGDYLHNSHVHLLTAPPLPNMDQVIFHIYAHPKLNLSRSAVQSKSWLPKGMSALVEHILKTQPGQTFLCVYKQEASMLAQRLSPSARETLAWMPHPDRPGELILPYFGGTNGSNAFRDCTNVILLGYPRLSPDVYLERCWAAWGQAGVGEQIRQTQVCMQYQKYPWHNGLGQIPLVREYEARHLASRMEQEIYRCKLRDASVRCEIHVFLFYPPINVWTLLHSRFPGCQVEQIDELPLCIRNVRSQQQQYGGKPTARAKLVQFLDTWDGSPIRVSDLRDLLDITPSAWKDLMKQMSASGELEQCGILRTGRSRYTTWSIPSRQDCPA